MWPMREVDIILCNTKWQCVLSAVMLVVWRQEGRLQLVEQFAAEILRDFTIDTDRRAPA